MGFVSIKCAKSENYQYSLKCNFFFSSLFGLGGRGDRLILFGQYACMVITVILDAHADDTSPVGFNAKGLWFCVVCCCDTCDYLKGVINMLSNQIVFINRILNLKK